MKQGSRRKKLAKEHYAGYNTPNNQYSYVTMKIDISEQAQAVWAINRELESVEAQQLKLGEKMSEVLYEQVVLAEKSRVLRETLKKFLNQ